MRHYNVISMLAGNRGHLRTFIPVSFTSASKHDIDAAGGKCTCGSQNLAHGVWRMCVVYHDQIISCVDTFGSALWKCKCCGCLCDGGTVKLLQCQNHNGSHQIVDIVSADQIGREVLGKCRALYREFCMFLVCGIQSYFEISAGKAEGYILIFFKQKIVLVGIVIVDDRFAGWL